MDNANGNGNDIANQALNNGKHNRKYITYLANCNFQIKSSMNYRNYEIGNLLFFETKDLSEKM